MDKITIKDALEKDVWKMVAAIEPMREVEVQMTYADLLKLCDKNVVRNIKAVARIQSENEAMFVAIGAMAKMQDVLSDYAREKDRGYDNSQRMGEVLHRAYQLQRSLWIMFEKFGIRGNVYEGAGKSLAKTVKRMEKKASEEDDN